ncbi:MAG TPA: DUF4382 domain-containing protein [Terracidiphilus sp.]|nr:DUF4382 domain-containing protein [Terracidiphilus sp.]
MSQSAHRRLFLPSLLVLAAASIFTAGCSNGSAVSSSSAIKGTSFIVGTDAPMASVTSFNVQIQSITATDANNNTVQLLSGSPTVDFARYNGLQTLLELNQVPAGTYTSVSITLGSGTIGYLDTSTPEPTIKTIPAVIPSGPITITLDKPLVITQNAPPVGLRIDFQLAKSIQVDSNGQITGNVTPTFKINTMGDDDSGAYIDEFVGGVVSTNSGAQTFVLQGEHGLQVTVSVSSQTEWEGNASFSDLSSSSIVEVSGKLDSTTGNLDADEVGILSQSGFYASGQITYVNPATGPAGSFDLYVRSLLPANTGLTLGQLATVQLGGSETYNIYWMHNPLTQYVFNQSTLVAGQDVAVGGPASGAASASNVTVKRVVLRHWGVVGTVVPGSENSNNNSFQMQVNGFAGVLIPTPITVYITGDSEFRDGWSGFGSISDNAKVRVVGLLLKDPNTGNTILIGHYVDDMEND